MLEHYLREYEGRVNYVSITGISNVTGIINPINEVAKLAHHYGAYIVVDAAQMAAHVPISMSGHNDPEMDIDALIFSGHKTYAPGSPGVVIARKDLIGKIEPEEVGGGMVDRVFPESYYVTTNFPDREEAGTPNIADAIATGVAADYLSNIGMENIWDHELELSKYALNKFSSYDKFTILGDYFSHLRGGVISFIHDKIHPHDIGTFLDQKGIAIRTGHHCAMPLIRSYDTSAAARISFYIYNTSEDIDQLIDGLNSAIKFFSY